MQTAIRPWVTSGIALIGASVIVVAPIAPPPTAELPRVHVPSIHLRAVNLQASIVDIFTFPVLRQWASNLVLD